MVLCVWSLYVSCACFAPFCCCFETLCDHFVSFVIFLCRFVCTSLSSVCVTFFVVDLWLFVVVLCWSFSGYLVSLCSRFCVRSHFVCLCGNFFCLFVLVSPFFVGVVGLIVIIFCLLSYFCVFFWSLWSFCVYLWSFYVSLCLFCSVL